MSLKIDLHTHTTYSDGLLTPGELVAEAAKAGVDVLSITDHDAVGALPEAAEACEKAGITLVPGTELTVYHEGREIHLLGYFIDTSQAWFMETLQTFQEARVERMEQMLVRMAGEGVQIAMADLKNGSQGSIGRPHLARALVRHGVCSNVNEAFRRYLVPGKPAYVEKFQVSLARGIEIIRDAGGLSVIAHPGISSAGGFVAEAKRLGLAGIEVYHCDHKSGQIRHFEQLAEKEQLLMTGGSDFHGGKIRQNSSVGSMAVPGDVYAKMLAALDRDPAKP